MNCKSRSLTKQQLLAAALGLLFHFSSGIGQAQITPSGDAYTNSAAPTTNYGAATLLSVDGAAETTYIKFNLASIPAGASVSLATLKIYVNAVSSAGSFNVDYVNGSWSESTIDHTNAPPLGSTIASDVAITAADKNQYILINMTSALQAWLTGSETNDGIALVANGAFNATFDSKENTTTSHPPELDIAYAGGAGTITGVTTASGSGLTGGGTSGTLNLSLTMGCSSGQVLSWNGSAWVCTALAGGGTITGVTAGTALTGGGTSGNVTLSLNTTQVPLLASNNLFTQNNIFEPFNTDAIDAYAAWPGKSALVGVQSATSGGSYGVWGQTLDPTGAGAAGTNYATSGTGVYGSGGSYGVQGFSTSGDGVLGTSTNGVGVWGSSTTAIGVLGVVSTSGTAVAGQANGPGTTALSGDSYGTSGGATGVEASTFDPNGSAVLGSNYGGGISVLGTQYGLCCAGYFTGDVEIEGSLSKAGGSFKIDHPLDPANKYLYHSFVESPDMKNIYDGVSTLDGNGEAVITLPEWFETLNSDFRYQLTCIGGFAPVYVAEEIGNNRFKIAGGKEGLKVSWQVTGIRQDAWANAHRIPVEKEKPELERGFYMHPELYGAPDEKGVLWATHPNLMKRLKEVRDKAAAHEPPVAAQTKR
jgi:hypothetical protein